MENIVESAKQYMYECGCDAVEESNDVELKAEYIQKMIESEGNADTIIKITVNGKEVTPREWYIDEDGNIIIEAI